MASMGTTCLLGYHLGSTVDIHGRANRAARCAITLRAQCLSSHQHVWQRTPVGQSNQTGGGLHHINMYLIINSRTLMVVQAQLDGAEYADVRNSTESLDELVHRNIQDVLATVRGDEEERPYGDAAGSSARTSPFPAQGVSTRQLSQKPTPPLSRTTSSAASKPGTATTTALPPSRRISTVGSTSRGSSGTNIATSTAPRPTPSSSSAARSVAPSHAPSSASPSRGAQPPTHDPHHSPSSNPSGLASAIIVQGPFPGGAAVSLDVPGNLEASLRLHKARIQGLEDDLMSMTRTAQGKVLCCMTYTATT